MTQDKNESRILKFIAESSLIIFSVLLALVISEWRKNYNEKVQTEKIVVNINNEILENHQVIKNLIPYHKKVHEKLTQVISNDSLKAKLFTENGFAFWELAPNGIIQETLNEIVWTVAKTEQITNRISIDKSRVLYEVYEQQNMLNKTIQRIIDLFSSREIHRENLLHENLIVLNTLFNELTGQEKMLNYKYENALKLLKVNK